MATTSTKAGRALVTGPVGVGKTTLIESYCSGCWREYSYEGSLEPCWRKQVTVGGTAVILDLEESYGQEEFSAMREALIRRANVILICFSVADRDSFVEAIDTFYPMVDRVVEGQRLIFLVGLKLDLVGTSGTFVTFQEGISAAIKIQAYAYFQCRLNSTLLRSSDG
ncbi:Ras family [Pelomyxa schiedti]|nr:Ras family [Pelomyxa schiedti]